MARQLNSSALSALSGTLWGSFLWRSDDALNDSRYSALMLGTEAGNAVDSAQFSLLPDGNNAGSKARLYLRGNSLTDPDNESVLAGETYLVLFKVTKVNGDASEGSELTMWILTADQFAHFKETGLTEAALDSATIGREAGEVLSRLAHARTGSARPLFTSAAYLQFRHFNSSGIKSFDEVRLSTAQTDAGLAEVTPIKPLTVSAHAGAADVTATGRGCVGC
jgi:hypothetical protein